MENYIVRIYRRAADDPDGVVGTVERAETQEQQHFHSLSALKRLLCGPHTDQSGDGKREFYHGTPGKFRIEKKTG